MPKKIKLSKTSSAISNVMPTILAAAISSIVMEIAVRELHRQQPRIVDMTYGR